MTSVSPIAWRDMFGEQAVDLETGSRSRGTEGSNPAFSTSQSSANLTILLEGLSTNVNPITRYPNHFTGERTDVVAPG
jgi:hypothetical protein